MAKYPIEFKKKVVCFYKDNGQSETLRVYNVSKESIIKWRRQSERDDFMRRKNRKYTVQEKLDVIAYYKANGRTATEERYEISNSVFYKWERILYEEGSEALGIERRGRKSVRPTKDINNNKDLLEELQYLRMENDYLKKLKALVEKREEQERKSK